MKTIIFALFCIVGLTTCQFHIPPEEMQKVLRYNTECQKKSRATQQEIMGTIQGVFSDSPALKDHIFCLGLKLKLITSDGEINRDAIKNKGMQVLQDEGKMDKLLDMCLLARDTPKDTAYDSIKCISDNRSVILNS